jgi:hypothetical protein
MSLISAYALQSNRTEEVDKFWDKLLDVIDWLITIRASCAGWGSEWTCRGV